MSGAIEYCVVHDQPPGRCESPGRCREIMTGWGLYEACAADELAALTENLALYGEAPPGALDSLPRRAMVAAKSTRGRFGPGTVAA